MKITDVQACVIGRPEPHSGGCVWTFVRIYTDEGITGTGECNSAGPGASGFAVKEAVLAMKRWLIGRDPTQVGPLYELLRRIGRYGGTSTAPLIFAITGILLQLGFSFLPVVWSSPGNIAYLVALYVSLQSAENVMHPPGPMLESDFGRIQVFFATLTLLLLFTAWQFARWMMELDQKRGKVVS